MVSQLQILYVFTLTRTAIHAHETALNGFISMNFISMNALETAFNGFVSTSLLLENRWKHWKWPWPLKTLKVTLTVENTESDPELFWKAGD
jgi:hypothetical protein